MLRKIFTPFGRGELIQLKDFGPPPPSPTGRISGAWSWPWQLPALYTTLEMTPRFDVLYAPPKRAGTYADLEMRIMKKFEDELAEAHTQRGRRITADIQRMLGISPKNKKRKP